MISFLENICFLKLRVFEYAIFLEGSPIYCTFAIEIHELIQFILSPCNINSVL